MARERSRGRRWVRRALILGLLVGIVFAVRNQQLAANERRFAPPAGG